MSETHDDAFATGHARGDASKRSGAGDREGRPPLTDGSSHGRNSTWSS
jgi:hypothetical protein